MVFLAEEPTEVNMDSCRTLEAEEKRKRDTQGMSRERGQDERRLGRRMGDKISTTASHGVLSLPIQTTSIAVVRLSRASRLNTAFRQEREFIFSLVKVIQELSHVRTLQNVLLCK